MVDHYFSSLPPPSSSFPFQNMNYRYVCVYFHFFSLLLMNNEHAAHVKPNGLHGPTCLDPTPNPEHVSSNTLTLTRSKSKSPRNIPAATLRGAPPQKRQSCMEFQLTFFYVLSPFPGENLDRECLNYQTFTAKYRRSHLEH